MPHHKLTHAGGVVLDTRGGDPLVLLARGKRHPHDWILPKGHIEKGETPEETALREVLEETGVEARLLSEVGDLKYLVGDDVVKVRFFLMSRVRSGPGSEGRELRWSTFADAEHLLPFESTRSVVRRAAELSRVLASVKK